ncbi:hypothetical protein BDN72DRAFT_966309 [Pluteus cervinus]|uniref:Uncharacterized protein n=1 Tax=Pluteus cervinus TaxID=181527 RepID=A0ACD2ZYD2_9AGAR|nr:hypothetical protein BDN72DRAFT_966309 [Pluteus cervinus]
MSSLQDKISAVRAAVVRRKPICEGLVDLDDKSSFLLYRKGETEARFIDLRSTTAKQLKELAEACLPATFGMDNKDVYDESYRKARKMDSENFGIKFDPEELGLLRVIRNGLLEGTDQAREIRAELYKLNVYDKGSFFKAHKDTPRGEKMFGSLVIVFPTKHTGGTLIFRHDGEEWKHNPLSLMKSHTAPAASYAAFYSDVEHEVAPVASGYRVTLTYNLYWKDTTATNTSSAAKLFTVPTQPSSTPLCNAITNLLNDEGCLPNGGYLGFGLRFMYPIRRLSESYGENLSPLLPHLKGSDALIKQACEALSLPISLQVSIKDEDRDGPQILVPRLPNLSGDEVDHHDSWFETLQGVGAVPVFETGEESEEDSWKELVWATPRTEFRTYSSSYIAYGNEHSTGHVYGDVCLVAKVGPHGARKEGV